MGISRINQTFKNLEQKNKKAFIPYIMAGDGGIEYTEELIYLLEKSGATVIELGVPFSDPVADGPTIQAADERALKNGTNLYEIIELIEKVRRTSDIPIVLMTYLNPILQYGIERFCKMSSKAGADGIIVPDLPLEEWGIIEGYLAEYEMAMIPLVTPTSGEERIKTLCERGKGYVYTVTVAGVTGTRTELAKGINNLLEKVKKISSLPVVAGFGISTKEQVEEISKYADGVVVGSKIVELANKRDLEAIKALVC